MMQRFHIVLIMLLLCALTACGGGTSSSTRSSSQAAVTQARVSDDSEPLQLAGETVPRRSLADIPFEFSWDLALPAPVHMTWVHEDLPNTLFVQTMKRQIHAIEIKTGHTKWVSRALPKLIELPPHVRREELSGRRRGRIILDDRLYVISDSILFCIDAVYGQIIWRYVLPFEPSTGPFATGSGEGLRVFIGDWQGHLRVITYHEEKMNPYVLWQWNLRGAPMADPVGEAGLVYVGNDRGVMQAFDHDRELTWEYEIGNTVRGDGVIRGRSLYFGSIDNVFHVVNRLSGQVMGQLYLDAPVERSPFIFTYDSKRVYVWTEGSGRVQGLHAVDAIPDKIPYTDTAEKKFDLEVERLKSVWFIPGLRHMVGATKKHLFLTYAGDSVVYAVDRSSGQAQWAWDVAEVYSDGGSRARRFSFCNYVDYNGSNQSIITYDEDGVLTAHKMFGQLGR